MCVRQHVCATVRYTFSTSVGLAMEEETTPETIPHITLVSNVSSERGGEGWEADCDCERAAFDSTQQCFTEMRSWHDKMMGHV